MGKFQIFQDGRAAGSAPVSGSDFVTKDYLSSNSIWIPGSGSSSVVLRHGRGGQTALATGEGAVAHGGIWGGYSSDYATLASGESSHAEGIMTRAQGNFSHVEGSGSVAQGYGSHAEGNYARSVGSVSHAEGSYTSASGYASHAEGSSSQATGVNSHAEGSSSKAVGSGSHAEGRSTEASGIFAHAEGTWTVAQGYGSHAEGNYTTASNRYEHAQGKYNATASNQIFSIGVGDAASRRKNAISVITGSGATPSASIFIYGIGGYGGTNPTTGTNDLATAFAKLTGSVASASYNSTDKKIYFYDNTGTAVASVDATDFIKDGMVDSVAVSGSYLVLTFNTDAGKEPVSMSLTQIFNPDNYYTKSDVDTLLTTMSVGDANVIEAVEFNGTASSISGKTASISVEIPAAPNQDAENWVTENSASIPTESVWVRGTGSGSAVLSGSNSQAIGQFSIAEGYQTVALGEYSHAEGTRTTASGDYSHAEGWRTTASADYAHAEGYRTVASGLHSHAEGYQTTAADISSHAEGAYSVASGAYSHAEGYSAKAMGEYSHAEGKFTVASESYEHAQGMFNHSTAGQIFSVGVGNSNAQKRNAISIVTGSGETPSASIYVYGVGSYDGTNPQPGTNDLATVIASLTGSQGGNTPLVIDVSSASWTDGGSGSSIVSANADGYFTVNPDLWNQAAKALKNNRDVYLYRWDIYGSDGNGFLYRASRFFSGSIPGFINFDVCYDSNVGGIKLIQFNPDGNIFFKTTNYVEESEDFWRSFTWWPGEGSGSAVLTDWDSEIPATATGQFAAAHGLAVSASGNYSHAEGYYTLASGTYSHAEGNSTIASGTYSHAEGYDTTASGMYSHAEGQYAIADGNGSHAEGSRTSASANYSHAEGREAIASGNYSHAEGFRTIASGMYSHAEGSKSLASGDYSHAEGGYTTASANHSHAEGSSTRAIGSSSHAEGSGSIASGRASHAEGRVTSASGDYSHAEGSSTRATGHGSHAEGVFTTASGDFSFAAGKGTWASGSNAFTVGQFNRVNKNQIFSIGAGISYNLDEPREDEDTVLKNAVEILLTSSEGSAGNPPITASLFVQGVGTYNGTNPAVGTNDLATVIKQLSASVGGGGGITSETDPIYRADSASLKSAATWVGSNSASIIASGALAKTAIQPAATASWDSAATSATALNSISASLIASGTLAKNVTAITASLIASASVAKTASSSAAALSAKSASWDAKISLPAVTAADNGKILRVVNGAWALVDPVTVYSGQGAPDSALGQDGDIYLQS